MDDLSDRLARLGPAIEKLMEVGGTPGLSLAVATKDAPVYHANFGYRDLENELPVTEKTVFPVCSLAKGLTASAMGILIERGKASWNTRASDAAPSFRPADAFLREHTTIEDLFSHRSGMSSCGNLVNGCEGNALISKGDRMRVVNNQTLLSAHLGAFAYNSTAYDLCDEIISSLSGSSVDHFLHENVFDPLELEKTSMAPPSRGLDNVTKCYNALDDSTPWAIPGPRFGDEGDCSGSGGLHSCAADLILLYRTFVRSLNYELKTGQSSHPLKQVSRLMSAHVPMPTKARNEVSYGLGWARVQLPNTLGHIGLNGRLMPEGMPLIGEGAPSQLVLYHQGTLPGALAVVILIPDTEGVILVLSNSLALTDVPDWVSQMVLEELLGAARTDFLPFAEKSISINLGWYDRIVGGLQNLRPDVSTPHRELESYVGRYVDKSGVFSVVVTLVDDVLFWALQGLDSERYRLSHHDGDVFSWLQTRNELSRRGRWVLGNDHDPKFWMVEFRAEGQRGISSISWKHDPLLEVIEYRKQ